MILIEATPHDIQSDTSLTPEEKREIMKLLPPKIKVGRLKSPYYAYGHMADYEVKLTLRDQGIVNVSFEWDKTG